MSGISKAVEDITGTSREMTKARRGREAGYADALNMLSGTRELGAQFTEFGGKALGRLSSLLDDPEAIRKTAGYQFRLEEGQKTIERGAAAKGGLFSGQALKELTRYGQEYATAERGAEMQRLASLAQMGLSGGSQAAGQSAQVRIGQAEAVAGSRERQQAQTIQHGQMISSAIMSGFGKGGGGGTTSKDTDTYTGSSKYFASEGSGGNRGVQFNMRDTWRAENS